MTHRPIETPRMMLDGPNSIDDSNSTEMPGSFTRIWAFFGLLLFAFSNGVWLPQTSLPQIPAAQFLIYVPEWLDWICLILTFVSLATLLKWNSSPTIQLSIFVMAISILMLMDQNRWQPWAYQYLIFGLLISFGKIDSVPWLRRIVISIYALSAISKFDYQFVHSLGPELISAIGEWLPGQPNFTELPPEVTLMLPVFELGIATALCFQRTRVLGVILACAMHFANLIVLGPWALNHQYPVLIWNLYFVFQTFWLFGPPMRKPANASSQSHSRKGGALRQISLQFVGLFAIAFAATASVNLCDHWLGWEVYAPRTSRADWTNPDKPKINSECLEKLGVPAYPQSRVQFAIRAAQVEFENLALSITVKSASDRWTGERITRLVRPDQIPIERSRFRLNTLPRSNWTEREK